MNENNVSYDDVISSEQNPCEDFIYNCAYYLLGSSEEAEAVLCQVILSLYDNFYVDSEIEIRKSFLCSLIIYEVENANRPDIKLWRSKTYNSESDLRNSYEDALFKLPYEYRKILVLKDIFKLNLKEIQAISQLSEQILRSRLNSARRMLFRILKRDMESLGISKSFVKQAEIISEGFTQQVLF